MAYATGLVWRGMGAPLGLTPANADAIDAILAAAHLHPTIAVDRTRLADSHEAWVWVTVTPEANPGYRLPVDGLGAGRWTGVVTWPNSD